VSTDWGNDPVGSVIDIKSLTMNQLLPIQNVMA